MATNYTLTDYGSYMVYDDGIYRSRFMQAYHHYPALRPLYPFKFEREFNSLTWAVWANDRTYLLFIILASYAGLVYLTKHLMKNREPIKSKTGLARWNLMLSLFSFIGAIRVWAHMVVSSYKNGFRSTFCSHFHDGIIFGAVGFWGFLFVASKVLEFGDTIYLIRLKKPVRFLHWYHHLTVCVLVWQGTRTFSSIIFYAAAFNYTVHTLMYYYYYCTAIGAKTWIKPRVLTVVQIVQMALACSFAGIMCYYRLVHEERSTCFVDHKHLLPLMGIVVSYLLLFTHYYFKRYKGGPPALFNGSVGRAEGVPSDKKVH